MGRIWQAHSQQEVVATNHLPCFHFRECNDKKLPLNKTEMSFQVAVLALLVICWKECLKNQDK